MRTRLLHVGKGAGNREVSRPAMRAQRADHLRRGTRGNRVSPRERGLRPRDVEQAMRIVEGTARSMGVEVG